MMMMAAAIWFAINIFLLDKNAWHRTFGIPYSKIHDRVGNKGGCILLLSEDSKVV